MPNIDRSVSNLNTEVYRAVQNVQNPSQMTKTEATAIRQAVLKDGTVDANEADLLAELTQADRNQANVRVSQSAEFNPTSLNLGPVSAEAAEELEISTMQLAGAKIRAKSEQASQWADRNIVQPTRENIIDPALERGRELVAQANEHIVQPALELADEYIVQPLQQAWNHVTQYNDAEGTRSENQANCGTASAKIVGLNLGLDMSSMRDIREDVGARTGDGTGAFALSTGQVIDAVENQAQREGRDITGTETPLSTNADQVLGQMRDRLEAGEQVILLSSNLRLQSQRSLQGNGGKGHYVVVTEVRPNGSFVISDPQERNGEPVEYSRDHLATHLRRRQRFGRENVMLSFRDNNPPAPTAPTGPRPTAN